MTLSTDQLIKIRRAVGTKPSDAELNAIYDRTADVDELVLEILETRLANLRAAPEQFSVPGEYSQSTKGQMDALESQIAALGGGAGTVVTIVDPYPQNPR
jgi:hypothetical protein